MKYIYDQNLNGKVALVTGAARGIGRACCLALAEVGAKVAVGLRDIKSDSGIINELKELGNEVDILPVQLDVSIKDQIDDSVQRVIDYFGKVDILVNNAGIAPPGLAENYTEKDFDDTVAINLKGTFFTSQAVARQMIKNNYGRIINLSSQAGFIALPEESVYCMTKAGIAHLTKCFAAEWAKYNINVNAVAPTFIETPGTEPWLNDPAFKADVLSKIVINKIGKPIDVASAVVYLASSAGDMITGSTLMVDGGWTIV